MAPEVRVATDGIDMGALQPANGAVVVTESPLSVSAHELDRWSYLACLAVRGEASPPREGLVILVTTEVIRGRVGAICVAPNLVDVAGGAVEWRPDDGKLQLTLPVYKNEEEFVLVFRTNSAEGAEFVIHDIRTGVRAAVKVPPEVPASRPELSKRAKGASRRDRVVVYTAVTNRYDSISAPAVVEEGCDYVCFTDDLEISVPPPWRARRIDRVDRDPRMTAKWYKVHPHLLFPEYETSIWVDGRIRITSDIQPLVTASIAGADFAAFPNPWYDCPYVEAEAITEEGMDRIEVVGPQLQRYRREGLPSHHGCLCGGVIVRRHKRRAVVKAMEAWWVEMERGSHRDQISLAYVLWRCSLRHQPISALIFDNSCFELDDHNFIDYYVSKSP
ncbi:MAG TPA: glycosyltransferase domain-containing protein [Dehalococcoidia bacterium]